MVEHVWKREPGARVRRCELCGLELSWFVWPVDRDDCPGPGGPPPEEVLE